MSETDRGRWYRHGDVDIIAVDKVPEGFKGKRYRRFTLAHGEHTGHHHTVAHSGLPFAVHTEKDECEDGLIEVGYLGDEQYMLLHEDLEIDHQQHGKGKIAKGFYRIDIEKEYNPFLKKLERVVD